MDLQTFKDLMSKKLHGLTVKEAHEKGICVNCKKPMKFNIMSAIDKDEYRISGLCAECFDKITKEE